MSAAALLALALPLAPAPADRQFSPLAGCWLVVLPDACFALPDSDALDAEGATVRLGDGRFTVTAPDGATLTGEATEGAGLVVLRWGDEWERFCLRLRVRGGRLLLADGRELAERAR